MKEFYESKYYDNDLAFFYAILAITNSSINLSKICVFYGKKDKNIFSCLTEYAQVQIFRDVPKNLDKKFVMVGEFDLGIRFIKNKFCLYSGSGNDLSEQKQKEFEQNYQKVMNWDKKQIENELKKFVYDDKKNRKHTNCILQKCEILDIILRSKKIGTIVKV